MKIRLYHIIFTLTLAIVTPSGIVCINAQDSGYFNEGSNEDGDTKERPHYSPGGEGESITSGTTTRVHAPVPSRDSARTVKALAIPANTVDNNKSSARQNEDEDDSVLSFNFLYYIIRKYKLQDIMD